MARPIPPHPLLQERKKNGADLGLKPFGIRAMNNLRLEKSYRLVGTELSIEFAAFESGLHRFVHPNKGDFIGRDALVAWRERGFDNAFVTLEVEGVTDADALGNEPLFKDGAMVGRATAGGYGWRLGNSLALGFLKPELAELGTEARSRSWAPTTAPGSSRKARMTRRMSA